jgi:hypothetical protein
MESGWKMNMLDIEPAIYDPVNYPAGAARADAFLRGGGYAADFEAFRKIARLNRDCVISEKIDGTNAQVFITDDGRIFIGSRSRWLDERNDNHGFWKWATANREELFKLGPGRHFGEWYGQGIQRNYGLQEKRFALFNTHKWSDDAVRPACCHVVPTLFKGPFKTDAIESVLHTLQLTGSKAAPGYMDPEGIVIFHEHASQLFKVTCKGDELHKSQVK